MTAQFIKDHPLAIDSPVCTAGSIQRFKVATNKNATAFLISTSWTITCGGVLYNYLLGTEQSLITVAT